MIFIISSTGNQQLKIARHIDMHTHSVIVAQQSPHRKHQGGAPKLVTDCGVENGNAGTEIHDMPCGSPVFVLLDYASSCIYFYAMLLLLFGGG